MSNPTVCAICLTADRHELTKKAVECFRAQTYKEKQLLVWDTSVLRDECLTDEEGSKGQRSFHVSAKRQKSIGALRNSANESARYLPCEPDILIHWDSDDWSHPNRIAEQVELLQASGADCVGYNEMLFWKEEARAPWATVYCVCGATYHRSGAPCPKCHTYPDYEAWLYRHQRQNYALGTSLCYWRKTWEEKPFEDIPRPGDMEGEDGRFIRGLKVMSVSSVGKIVQLDPGTFYSIAGDEPRMIARIHAGNSSTQYRDIAKSDNWRRVTAWDALVKEILK